MESRPSEEDFRQMIEALDACAKDVEHLIGDFDPFTSKVTFVPDKDPSIVSRPSGQGDKGNFTVEVSRAQIHKTRIKLAGILRIVPLIGDEKIRDALRDILKRSYELLLSRAVDELIRYEDIIKNEDLKVNKKIASLSAAIAVLYAGVFLVPDARHWSLAAVAGISALASATLFGVSRSKEKSWTMMLKNRKKMQDIFEKEPT